MGVELDTRPFGAPEELLELTPRAKTKSLGSPRRRAASASLRKSLSDKPLGGASLAASASLQSELATNQLGQLDGPPLSGHRERLMERADEILRGKQQVGVQLGDTCPVCLADDVDTQLSNCGHRVHAKCIKRWIQSGAKCPVCREVVTGVEEAFAGPPSALYHPLEKDLSSDYTSEDASTSTDNQTNEWGWFEEFDDFEETMDEAELMQHLHTRRKHSLQGELLGGEPHSISPLMNREMSTTFEVCRTFAPLRLEYDAPYSESKHEFMRGLPSHRHIAAKIQIRSFRIVESTTSKNQHAEYLLELQLDRKYFSRWRRFSELSKFVGTLGSIQFRRTLAAWAALEASSRWFNRLELSYLHKRCRMLEEFAHALLQESSSAHPLADLLDG